MRPTKTAFKIGCLLGFVAATLQLYCLEAPVTESPTFAELIRPKIVWPCKVKLTESHKISVIEKDVFYGRVELSKGLTLKAESIDNDGILIVSWADLKVHVPMEKTDLLHQLRMPFISN